MHICCCALVYSAWYLVPGTTSLLSYQSVIPVTPGENLRRYHHQAPRTQTGFGCEQRWMAGILRGLHRRHHGRNRFRVGGVRGPNLNAHTRIHGYTGEVRIIKLNKPTLWANVLGIFSQALARRRPLDNGEKSSLRSDVCFSLLEGWEWGAWQMPSSGQTPDCVKLLR